MALGLLSALISTSSGEVPPRPSIEDFYPEILFFEGTPFAMNRIMLVRVIAVVAICVIFAIGAARAKKVPGRFQGALEIVLDFVRTQIAGAVIESPKLAKRYTPPLTVIFLGIFAMNITGVLPFLNIAGTSVVGAPIVFALFSYLLFIGAGIKEQGFLHFFKSQLFPPGVPKPVYILLTPIEVFSTFIVRPVTLVIRLLANMLAGHLMLALTFFGTHYLLFFADGFLKGAAALTFTGSLFTILLETLVAGIQAFVFAMLTAIYIQLSVSEH
ncbi:ATP synthase F0 subunit A [Boudabousia liubingyangii]|uniref:ATP synthase subunit a n=1 Tax=Boudabousia liubingyangii TaxID=1921764 RepID=A0A1Q5PKT0_9ACTO|nr:F0F1 ATP synthase subunit A [Boudabousia liubingyangii]OKL46429.1 ATP synthase F0 subunit A [Boudabousia liubingyangii]OKL47248.1 ATP synthase F0 subunit A [Boudabousia liubingyangii]